MLLNIPLDEALFQILLKLSLAVLFLGTLGYTALYSFSRFLSEAKGGAMIAFLGCVGLMLMVTGELFYEEPPEILTQFESTNWVVKQYLKADQSQYVQYYTTHIPKNSLQYYLTFFICLSLLLLGYMRVTSKFTYKYAPFVQAEVQQKPAPSSRQQPIPAKPLHKAGPGTQGDPRLDTLRSQQQQQEQLKAKMQAQNRPKA
ncbi:MAG: hypothetical protein AABZ60_16540 [Planctomycetota bacterium]